MSEIFNDISHVHENQPIGEPRKKRNIAKILRTGIVLGIVTTAVVCAATIAWPFVKETIFPAPADDYSGNAGPEVVITIPEGALGTDIAKLMVENNVVASEEAFIEAFGKNPRSNYIQAGSYKIPTKISAADAVAALLDPASRAENTITIPEGYTAQQVYEKIANVSGVGVEDVAQAAADTKALGLPEEANGNIEGWLAPLTYEFAPETPVSEILATMVKNRVQQLEQSGISPEQWQRSIIVASIAQREVLFPEEYGKVARVIENRLVDTTQTHGVLGMDSTVLYGLGRLSGDLTQAELDDTSNPYNTRALKGLPPGPICNPSLEAIEASANPPEGDWLYFVTVNPDTGETRFTNNSDVHQQNVLLYRQWQEKNNSDAGGDQ